MANRVYSLHARILHWLTVVIVLGMITVGLLLGTVKGPMGDTLYFFHKSFGMLLFLIIAWRLARRLIGGVPASSQMITPVQKVASEIVHWALYAALLLMPIAGYVIVAAFPAPLDFFGLQAPNLIGKDRPLSELAADVHGTIAFIMMGLIAIHVAAALFHWFIKKDDVLPSMLPGLYRKLGR